MILHKVIFFNPVAYFMVERTSMEQVIRRKLP